MQTPTELGLTHPEWRTGQRLAIRTALNAKTSHIIIQAPTGAGKTAIALGILMMDRRRSAVLTASKALQQQYRHDAPWLTDVRGMGNYPCLAAKDEFRSYFPFARREVMCDDGPCHSDVACTLHEDGCSYFDAYRRAKADSQVLTNYAYWIAMRRFAGPSSLGMFRRVICDEAHDAPSQLMSSLQVSIPGHEVEGRLPTRLAEWQHWAADRLQEIKAKTNDVDVRVKRRRLTESLERILQMDGSWVWEVQGGDSQRVVFEPVRPRQLSRFLFDKDQSVVYMSATVTESMADVLGIDPSDVTFLALASRFPVDRRPIYMIKTAWLSHRSTADDYRYWLEQIDRFIETRRDRKGLIHSVSYDRARYIKQYSAHRDLMVVPDSKGLADAVARHKRTSRPSILVSPAITTGHDFPRTACEYNIIAKVPFPDTRSPIMKARIKANPGIRDYITSQAIVQMAGRGMRADDDSCETAIFDNHFMQMIQHKPYLFPEYFRDAVIVTGRVPPPLPRLRD